MAIRGRRSWAAVSAGVTWRRWSTALTRCAARPASGCAAARTPSRSWPRAGSSRRRIRSACRSTHRRRSAPSPRRRPAAAATWPPTPTRRRRSRWRGTGCVTVAWHGGGGCGPARVLRAGHGAGAAERRARDLEFTRTTEIVLRRLPAAPGVVADIGGGPGRYALWLASLGYQVEHRDLMPLHVEQLTADTAGVAGIRTAVGDVRELDLPDAC